MNPTLQFALSITLTFGIPLAFAVHELIALRRPPRRPGGFPDDPPRAPAPPLFPGDAPAIPRLPACLIPNLPPAPPASRPSRERVLEPA